MVAAVFQSPLAGAPDKPAASAAAHFVSNSVHKLPFDWRGLWLKVVPPILGLALLVGVWAMVSVTSSNNFPSPWATAQQAVQVFSDPFHTKGPNDQGIGWNIWSSLKRVAVGFGLRAAWGVPLLRRTGRWVSDSCMTYPANPGWPRERREHRPPSTRESRRNGGTRRESRPRRSGFSPASRQSPPRHSLLIAG